MSIFSRCLYCGKLGRDYDAMHYDCWVEFSERDRELQDRVTELTRFFMWETEREDSLRELVTRSLYYNNKKLENKKEEHES